MDDTGYGEGRESNHLDWCICVLECQVWSSVMEISRSLAASAG
jgi:hypothetical protein